MADTSQGGPARRGPTEDRGVTTERIVTAARLSFAELGWAGTTMRGVARDAGVDSRLVTYYFKDKTVLLQACLQVPDGFVQRVREAASEPLNRRGAGLVTAMLANWNDPATAVILRSVILTAAHEPVALERLQLVFRTALVGAVADSLDDGERLIRAGLVSSQIVGLFMTRYIWKIEPMKSLPDEEIVRLIAPTVQRYLGGPIG